ncbi:OsmC-like protein [Caulifigura coniformis]|uniref:OsmC-like protein n=1 Tax=Caulifigura coniformis TaxID=2527983 RepID=A0A517SJQ9_9PLAN|nr:OsmC family protein [Caulifigura coniformis]QDT56346.1 OsmC-like protein [Caulifigura coniformis]
MTPEELRAVQTPFKERYRSDPASALATLSATGTLDVARLQCVVDGAGGGRVIAGVHPRAGGDGAGKCAGDMLLEALVGCAGVTLAAVSTAMNLGVTAGRLSAEGDLDFRGTLGVSRDAPIGFTAIRVSFELETDAGEAQLQKLGELTERYCVVAQSLNAPVSISIRRVGPPGQVGNG